MHSLHYCRCDNDDVKIVVEFSVYPEELPTIYLHGLDIMAMDYAATNQCEAIFVLNLGPGVHHTYSAPVCSTPSYEREALILKVPPSSSFFSHFSLQKTSCSSSVHFEIKHTCKLHTNIDLISKSVLSKLLPSPPLAPCQFPIPVKRSFVRNVRLDENYQKKALRQILSCSPDAPFLLLGPFGTGKTYLLAAAVVKVLEEDANCKVLVCTHHKRCADGLCQNLEYNMGIKDASIYIARVISKHDTERDMNQCRVNVPVLGVNDQTLLYTDWPVIVTTFMTAAHLFDNRHHFDFTHIFIDEGAQCSEPELLGALILATPKTKVVVVGDNKQVGGYVMNGFLTCVNHYIV